MDLRKALMQEHSKRQCSKIVRFIGSDPRRYAELISLFLSGPYRITQRAAWPIRVAASREPALVKPHLSHLIKFLQKAGTHPAARRNILGILAEVDIPGKYGSRLIEFCFSTLTNAKEPIAIRAFSMTVLSRITHPYPEIQRELIIVLEDLIPYGSAGLRSRAVKTIKALNVSV
jgi:hypothetical protein